MEQPSAEFRRQETLAYLEAHHEKWSPLYNRVLRSAGLDAELNERFRPLNEQMDKLLDDLIAQTFALEMEHEQVAA